MVKGATKSGFEFEIDTEAVDMELLDMIGEMDENPVMLGKVLSRLLGKEQKARLYDHVRDEKGHVPVQAVADALAEMFSAFKDGKNS